MNGSWHISRRTMLKGVGASMALPMLEVMSPASARAAATATPPKRLACVFQPNGVFPKAWNVKGTGADYKLSPILEPLAKVRDDVLVLSKVDGTGGDHVVATTSFLIGVKVDKKGGGVSLDQWVAQKLGGQTRRPGLELGTEPPRQGKTSLPIAMASTVSWNSPTTQVPVEINPQVAFDRLFRVDKSVDARRRAEDARSVIDLVRDDAKRLDRNISTADRRKLDEYLSGVRSVETRIAAALKPQQSSWTPKTKPTLTRPGDGIPVRRDEHLKLMIDLIVTAMWTDTTRVATLMTAHGFSRQNFSFLDGVSLDHHSMSHHKNKEKWTDEYVTVSRWYIEQLAYMLERMKSIDEGGSTLLDNSIVLYGSGLKDGNGHVPKDLPLLVAGRGGGTLKPGRHVQCKSGTNLANLHLTIANAMGIETDKFNGVSGQIDGLG